MVSLTRVVVGVSIGDGVGIGISRTIRCPVLDLSIKGLGLNLQSPNSSD